MQLFDIDLNGIFNLSVSPLQLMLRGTLTYWFLFVIFRFLLRRDAGSVGISGFLFVVILGNAAQNAMIGSATSAIDGMVLIATLVFWNYLLDFLSLYIPAVERFTSPSRLCLVRAGMRHAHGRPKDGSLPLGGPEPGRSPSLRTVCAWRRAGPSAGQTARSARVPQ